MASKLAPASPRTDQIPKGNPERPNLHLLQYLVQEVHEPLARLLRLLCRRLPLLPHAFERAPSSLLPPYAFPLPPSSSARGTFPRLPSGLPRMPFCFPGASCDTLHPLPCFVS